MQALREIVWVLSAKRDLMQFPDEVIDEVGHSLYIAQLGGYPLAAKPLRGFGGANVLEVIEDFDSDTYRAVYTVRFEGRIYVLHCFQKKSTSGSKTPQQDIEKIKGRLRMAEEIHQHWKQNG